MSDQIKVWTCRICGEQSVAHGEIEAHCRGLSDETRHKGKPMVLETYESQSRSATTKLNTILDLAQDKFHLDGDLHTAHLDKENGDEWPEESVQQTRRDRDAACRKLNEELRSAITSRKEQES